MIDYHLHLWEHPNKATQFTLETLAEYCRKAESMGIKQIAVTEHFHRFTQSKQWLGKFWTKFDDHELYESMEAYFDHHATYDIEEYISIALLAKESGLPIVVGLEMDYFKDNMEFLNDKLRQYPFDVILGSVHWLKNWRFDDLYDTVSMKVWDSTDLENIWAEYSYHMEELASANSCDVLAHPDLIKVNSNLLKDTGLINEFNLRIAESANRFDLAAEVSSAGYRKPIKEQYPSHDLLQLFLAKDVPITTASDAHKISDIGYRFDSIMALIKEFNVNKLATFNQRMRSYIDL